MVQKEPVTTVLQSSSLVLRLFLCPVYSSYTVLLVLVYANMCLWALSLQSNRENEFYSKLADLHLEKYNFPVEMIICLPNGTVVCWLLLELSLALPIRAHSLQGCLQTLERPLLQPFPGSLRLAGAIVPPSAVLSGMLWQTASNSMKKPGSVSLYRDRTVAA